MDRRASRSAVIKDDFIPPSLHLGLQIGDVRRLGSLMRQCGFKTENPDSFKRQLNNHGFKSFQSTSHLFWHPHFGMTGSEDHLIRPRSQASGGRGRRSLTARRNKRRACTSPRQRPARGQKSTTMTPRKRKASSTDDESESESVDEEEWATSSGSSSDEPRARKCRQRPSFSSPASASSTPSVNQPTVAVWDDEESDDSEASTGIPSRC